jgi:hypothetical protein
MKAISDKKKGDVYEEILHSFNEFYAVFITISITGNGK